MMTPRRPPGRPQKREGAVELFWRFSRPGIVMCIYDEARENGEKHSAAVTEVVDYVRQHYPKLPISETEVKRILATYRPRNSQTILRFKRLTLDNEKLARLRCMLEQVPSVQGDNCPSAPSSSIQNLPESLTSYQFRFAERPQYPRHNRKIPRE